MEDHIKEKKNDDKYNGKNNFQSLFGPQLKLVLARPLVAVSGRRFEALRQQLPGLVDEPTIIFGVEVNEDIAGQLPIFVANHGGDTRKRNPPHPHFLSRAAPHGGPHNSAAP